MYCADHAVARCRQCHEDITAAQIGADLVGGGRDFCPFCRADLTEAIRWHILECEAISAAIDERIQTASVLKKMSEERKLRSEILSAESEILVKRVLARRRPGN